MIKKSFGIYAFIALIAGAATAQPSPPDRNVPFFVVNMTSHKEETSFNVSSLEDPIIKSKKDFAEGSRRSLMQISRPANIQLRVVMYEHCSGRICGEFLPVAGTFSTYDSASDFCTYMSGWKTELKITCEVVKVEPNPKDPFTYYSVCQSVPEWCPQEKH